MKRLSSEDNVMKFVRNIIKLSVKMNSKSNSSIKRMQKFRDWLKRLETYKVTLVTTIRTRKS